MVEGLNEGMGGRKVCGLGWRRMGGLRIGTGKIAGEILFLPGGPT